MLRAIGSAHSANLDLSRGTRIVFLLFAIIYPCLPVCRDEAFPNIAGDCSRRFRTSCLVSPHGEGHLFAPPTTLSLEVAIRVDTFIAYPAVAIAVFYEL